MTTTGVNSSFASGWLLRDCNRASLRVAEERLSRAKEKMDDALAALNAAESEWFAAIAECERLESQARARPRQSNSQ